MLSLSVLLAVTKYLLRTLRREGFILIYISKKYSLSWQRKDDLRRGGSVTSTVRKKRINKKPSCPDINQGPPLSDQIPPSRSHLIKFSQLCKTAFSPGVQVFKYMSSWGDICIQTTSSIYVGCPESTFLLSRNLHENSAL